MTTRSEHLARIGKLFRDFPVVAIVGPRQVGKTTLASQFVTTLRGTVHSFDLERPADLRKLADPMLALEGLEGTVVLDEIQRLPEVFPVLRVLVDRPRSSARFLVLGSASPELLSQSSESLAGRIAYHHLPGFQPDEVGPKLIDRLWLRGGFPRSFLARNDEASLQWREEFVQTFLERDLAQFNVRTPATTMRRFWTMIAHYHGQIWNASDFARSLGQSDQAARRYLDQLAATLVVRVLQPFHANLKKRQVKSPKVFIADSGLLHVLLGLPTLAALRGHARAGASFEGFAMTAVVEAMEARPHECSFWATYSGAELDLLVQRGDRRVGVEFKLSSAPELTPSMRIALEDLELDRMWVVHAGKDTIKLASKVTALPLAQVASTRLW
jgi:predicted AAA+ superfamily ATPase